MALTDPGKLLDRIGGSVERRGILVHVIGTRLRDQESGRSVPMLNDCPAFTVHVTDAGFAPPTEQQKKDILKFWIENPLAPDSYEWVESGGPVLKIPKKPKSKKSKSPSHTEENDL